MVKESSFVAMFLTIKAGAVLTLTNTDDQPRTWQALFMDCTRDSVYEMLRAEIDWATRTLQRIDDYEAHGRIDERGALSLQGILARIIPGARAF